MAGGAGGQVLFERAKASETNVFMIQSVVIRLKCDLFIINRAEDS